MPEHCQTDTWVMGSVDSLSHGQHFLRWRDKQTSAYLCHDQYFVIVHYSRRFYKPPKFKSTRPSIYSILNNISSVWVKLSWPFAVFIKIMSVKGLSSELTVWIKQLWNLFKDFLALKVDIILVLSFQIGNMMGEKTKIIAIMQWSVYGSSVLWN